MRAPVALVLLAACSPDGLAVGVPWLELPRSVAIDDARFGRPNDVAVPLTNSGTAEAAVEATVSPEPPFIAAGETLHVGAGATAGLTFLFTPADFEPVDGSIVITDGLDTWELPIHATVDRDVDDDGHEAIEAGGDDCDEDDPARFPGAVEACDGVDQDCDGVVDDDADGPSWWPDVDGDTYGDGSVAPYLGCDPPAGSVVVDGDCDDALATVHPGAFEVWYDGIDQDCDGNDDDRDLDGVPSPLDCDDLDPAVLPGAVETWYDGTDQDCDGNDDDQDLDGDPFPADCEDLDPLVGPAAPELDDGLDQDCDLLIDEDLWARGALLVTEFLPDPAAVADGPGHWLELHNPTDGHVDLGQVVVTVGSQVSSPAAGWLAPGGVVVLCANPDLLVNGGVVCDGSLVWNNGARTIAVDGGGLALDEVTWSGWPIQVGAAAELRLAWFDADANDLAASWCVATTPFGAGDLGTPGSVAAPCP